VSGQYRIKTVLTFMDDYHEKELPHRFTST